MLERDSGFYLHVPVPAGSERMLHPGRVVCAQGGMYTAEMEEQDLVLPPGLAVVLCFERDGRFQQQPARVDAVLETQPRLIIGLECMGSASSAEARQAYRVSTVTSGLTVMVGAEECLLLDISATGLAVVASEPYLPGQTVSVSLTYDRRTFTGTARVQSIRRLRDRRIRYGLHGADDRVAGGTLEKGLREVAMAIQRKQLQRRARD